MHVEQLTFFHVAIWTVHFFHRILTISLCGIQVPVVPTQPKGEGKKKSTLNVQDVGVPRASKDTTGA